MAPLARHAKAPSMAIAIEGLLYVNCLGATRAKRLGRRGVVSLAL